MPVPSTPIQITSGNENSPEIIAYKDGFYVVWNRLGEANETALLGQRFDVNGQAVGAQAVFEDYAFQGGRGELVDLGKGRLGMVWVADDGTGANHIFAGMVNVAKGEMVRPIDLGQTVNTIHDAAVMKNGMVAIITTRGDVSNPFDPEKVPVLITIDTKTGKVREQALSDGYNEDGLNTFGQTVIATKTGGVAFYRDTEDGQLYSRGFDQGGALKAERQVNTTHEAGGFVVDKVTFEVQATALKGGGYVAVWTSLESDGSGFDLRGRLFAESGAPLGDDFLITTVQEGNQTQPQVLATPDGGFAVQWLNTDVTAISMKMRTYDKDANATSGEIVTEANLGFVLYTDIESTLLSNGQIVSVWNGPFFTPGLVVDGIDLPGAGPVEDAWIDLTLQGHLDLRSEAGLYGHDLIV